MPTAGDGDCRAGLHCLPDDDPSASNNFALFCAFAKGEGTAMAPCVEDADCGSGACRPDPTGEGEYDFCFAACADDADCNVGGREGVCDVDFIFSTDFAKDVKVRGCRPVWSRVP